MKKILAILLSSLLCFMLTAQDHLTFKNIPITGKMNTFTAILIREGFVKIKKEKTTTILEGTFAGIEECTVYVAGTKKTKTAWKVMIDLPTQHSWESLYERYEKLVSEFTEKYGTPTDHFAYFAYPHRLKDGLELEALSLNKGSYSSFWFLPTGSILIDIIASNKTNGNIRLSYEDKEGVNLKALEEKQIIQDDI